MARKMGETGEDYIKGVNKGEHLKEPHGQKHQVPHTVPGTR